MPASELVALNRPFPRQAGQICPLARELSEDVETSNPSLRATERPLLYARLQKAYM